MTARAELNGGLYNDPNDVEGMMGKESMDSGPQLPDDQELRQRGITALYGQDCPLAIDSNEEPEDADLVSWARSLWNRHSPAAAEPMIVADRNRGMRKGNQWVTRDSATGPFKEPPQPRDSVRPVANMIRPALEQRIQIMTEQRPGYRVEQGTEDPEAEERAQAQQQALEYHFRNQGKKKLMREAAYWAQTDGISYFFKYWDPDGGPWSEQYDPSGVKQKMGDVATMVLRIEEVRVSANASSTRKPFYWIVKKPIATAEAVQLYGDKVLEGSNDSTARTDSDQSTTTARGFRHGAMTSTPDDMLEDQPTLDRYWLFIAPSDYFPQGYLVHCVGEAVVYADQLECGVVPLIRVTDGSADPNWYAEPVMNDWIDEQMRVNVLLRLWIEGIRRNVGGRYMHKQNAIKSEQLVGGLVTAIEVSGGSTLADAMQVIPPVPIGVDIKELLALEVKNFENKSGWNDTSRGSFQNDESGRAVLAQREILERIFTPPVDAMAEALSEDAKLDLAFMACYYDEPRRIAVVGESRPDLGRLVSSEDFDGTAEVYIDPETMMPLPRSLRLFLLDQMYDKGQMTAAEWRRRSPFASVRNLSTPDDDQEAAAKRLCFRLRQGSDPNVEQIWWQWNESIFQDVLERELILKDSVDGRIRLNADVMWKRIAAQASLKNSLLAPPAPVVAPTGGGGQGPGAKQGRKGAQPGAAGGMPASRSPLASQSPGVAAAPMGMQTDTQRLAGQFDAANAR